MKAATKLRIGGGVVFFFLLWVVGHYNIEGIPAGLLTVGFAVAFEVFVVQPAAKRDRGQPPPPGQ